MSADSKMQVYKSELVNGVIPPHTVCPFKNECVYAEADDCHHKGENHTNSFSCGLARAFDLSKRNASYGKR